MQTGQCGTKLCEVAMCDENGIGGGGEYSGGNDAQLGRINEFNHEASGGKYMPRAVLFELEPGVIDTQLRCDSLARVVHAPKAANSLHA
jgi:tubulin beta